MKLSIYTGLRSIAWVISENSKIVKYGIKRLNISFDNYYEYIAGLPVSKRINRRQKRTARRNLLRFKRRKQKLVLFLQNNGFLGYKKYSQKEKLLIRAKASKEKIDIDLVGVALLSIATKRGYKSMRGASMNDASEYLKTIATHEENLKNFKCVADYFLSLKSLKDVVLLRETYEKEFFQICNVQNLDAYIVKKLHNIIFFQRPIKQNNTSYCKYERRKVMHGSNPDYQKFRCLRDANNIVVWDENENELDIPTNIRSKWAQDLYVGKNLTKASVCKDLGIKKSTTYSWLSGKSLIGYELQKICTNFGINLTDELWQDLFSATDNTKLEKLLLSKYAFSKTQADILCETDIHLYGWSEYSAKAVKKLEPYLVKGEKLSDAVLALYGKVDMKEVVLRNLILEQHFYSTESLIKKLKQKYNLTEFAFEIDSLLKMGNKSRKTAAQELRKDFALKKKYATELEGKTDYEFQKLKAWLELKGTKADAPSISPLEPNHVITLEEALSDAYNFDHIVPKSKIFERSNQNLMLCRKEINETKKQKTAVEFAEELGILEDYKTLAEQLPHKKEYLLMDQNNIPTNAVSKKQNADYNTRCFATLFDNAVNIPNKVISLYQREWNINKFKQNDVRFALEKAFVLANFSQQDINYFDNIKDTPKPYQLACRLERLDFSNVPVFLPRIKHTRKVGNTINPRARLHEETIFGKRKINGKTYFVCRKPLEALTDKVVKQIVDGALQKFILAEIAKYGSLEGAKIKWAEQLPIFNNHELKSVTYFLNSTALVPIKMKEGVLVDYVYPDARYLLNLQITDKNIQKQQLTLLQFLKEIKNKNKIERNFYLQQNSVVELNGQYYFLVGVGESPNFRSIYDLDAVSLRSNATHLKNLKKVLVNQLGEVKKVVKNVNS